MQQIGCWDPMTLPQILGSGTKLVHGDAPVDMAAGVEAKGYGLYEQQDAWSSVAYFYLDRA